MTRHSPTSSPEVFNQVEINAEITELEEELKQIRAKQFRCCFYSPGTFFTEQSSYQITRESTAKNIKWAVNKAKSVTERYDAKPFGFKFTDGNGVSLSGMYFITGKLMRYEEVPDTKDNSIMRSNMRCNDMAICIENTNSFRYTGNFDVNDAIVNWDGEVTRRGSDSDLLEYRNTFKEQVEEYYARS